MAWHQIPSLNDIAPEKIVDHSLVRFRCMIQDTLGLELYHGVYEHKDKSGKVVRAEMRAHVCWLMR